MGSSCYRNNAITLRTLEAARRVLGVLLLRSIAGDQGSNLQVFA